MNYWPSTEITVDPSGNTMPGTSSPSRLGVSPVAVEYSGNGTVCSATAIGTAPFCFSRNTAHWQNSIVVLPALRHSCCSPVSDSRRAPKRQRSLGRHCCSHLCSHHSRCPTHSLDCIPIHNYAHIPIHIHIPIRSLVHHSPVHRNPDLF